MTSVPNRRFTDIMISIGSKYFKDIADVDYIECEDINIIKLKVVPYEYIHKDIPYFLTLKFQDDDSWPLLYVDSDIFDKLKSKQYILNKGKNGFHKGICIQHFTYHYSGYRKYFKLYCDNKWKNYIYQIIDFFNNITEQDYVGGFGKLNW